MKNDYQAFVEKREKLVNSWRYVGSLCLLGIIGFGIWLFIRTPQLINPFFVVEKLEHNQLEASTLYLMAVMLPIMTLTCLALLAAMIVLGFAVFSREKKYIETIKELAKR